MTARSVPEWIGKTPDTAAPQRVRIRCFERAEGRCHICGVKIQVGEKWQLDHIQALIEGGENREGNLAPAHDKCHKPKTRQEVARKSKVARMKAKHIGAVEKRPWSPNLKKKIDGSVVDRRTGEPV